MMRTRNCIAALAFAAASLSACAAPPVRGSQPAAVAPRVEEVKPPSPPPDVKPKGEAVSLSQGQAPGIVKAEAGKPFVDFVGRRIDGGVLRLSEEIGRKVVVLQFWGVRCAPCLAEMAFFSELQRRQEEQLLIVGVNTDRVSESDLRQAMSARQISASYPLVADPDFSISQHYTEWLVPVGVLIDRKGVVRAVYTGFSDNVKVQLQAEIEGLIREAL